MLSDVTLGLSGHTLTLAGTDLLVGCILVLSISVLAMALNRGRRVELRHSATTDILIVQLERIGDTLDRIVAQNASLSAAVIAQQAIAHLKSEAAGIITVEASKTTEQRQAPLQAQQTVAQPDQPQPGEASPPDESVLSEEVRSVVYSMLRS